MVSPLSYEIVCVDQWLNGWPKAKRSTSGEEDASDSGRNKLPLVDLRSYDAFDERHLSVSTKAASVDVERNIAKGYTTDTKINASAASRSTNGNGQNQDGGATVVNLPLSTLLSGERSCELPPRHVAFAILIPAQFTHEFLTSENCPIHSFFFATRSKATMASRMPWLVRQVLMDGGSLWKAARVRGLTRSGLDRGFPRPRLWKPDPLVEQQILPFLKEWMPRSHHCGKKRAAEISSEELVSKRISTGIVLDLGSGSGRDICYLAEELRAQCQQDQCPRLINFVGVDNHKGSAKRCLPLWNHRGVGDTCNTCNIDLNKLHRVRDHFVDLRKFSSRLPTTAEVPRILCIFAIRFLNRKLFSYIANSLSVDEELASIAPATVTPKSKKAVHSPPPPLMLPLGTLVAISHFCKSGDGAGWNFDHPKESSVLNRWELKCLFDNGTRDKKGGILKKWQIVKDDIVSDGDHGRTLIQFVVKKVA